MASPVLLVADDLPLITAVKRVLAREGHEVVLATSAADAEISWGHSLPGLLLLQPSVESGRGTLLLDELQRHPDAKLLRVLLLGELVPGHPWPVEPLPIEPAHFARAVEENRRAAGGSTSWRIAEPEKPLPAPSILEPAGLDTWSTTRPAELDEAKLPPNEAGTSSSETGAHLADTLREDPSLLWPSPNPTPISAGSAGSLGPPPVDLRLTPVDATRASGSRKKPRHERAERLTPTPPSDEPAAAPTATGGAPSPAGREERPAERTPSSAVGQGTGETAGAPERRSRPPSARVASPRDSTASPAEQAPSRVRRTVLPVPSAGATRPSSQSEQGAVQSEQGAVDDASRLSDWAPERASPADVVNPTGEETLSLRKRPTGSWQPAPGAGVPVLGAVPEQGTITALPPSVDRPTPLPLPLPLPLPGPGEAERAISQEVTGAGARRSHRAAAPEPTLVPETPGAPLPSSPSPEVSAPARVAEWDTLPSREDAAAPPGLVRSSRPVAPGFALAGAPVAQLGAFVSSPLTPEEIEALEPTLPSAAGSMSSPSAVALAERLFGDLPAIEDEVHRHIEAEALASVESSLRHDEALRKAASAASVTSALSVLAPSAEPTVAPVEARASDVLARAEAMLGEGRAAFEEGTRGLEDEAAKRQDESAARSGLEAEVLRLKASVELLERAALAEKATHAAALEAARAHGAARLSLREGELTETAKAWEARAQGAEADLGLMRAEVGALTDEVREREQRLDQLVKERDEREAELVRERQERVAEISQRQADAISALSRQHEEQVAELRYLLSEAQASGEISKAEAAAVGEVSRQLFEEQAAHAQTRRLLAGVEARVVELEAERAQHEAQREELAHQLETERAQHEAWQAELGRQLEAERGQHEVQQAELERRLEAERGQHEARKAELERRLETEHAEHEVQQAELGRQLEAERGQHEARQAELERRLETEHAEHEVQQAELGRQLEAERGQHEARQAELERQLETEQGARDARLAGDRADLAARLESERIDHATQLSAQLSAQRSELEARLDAERAEHEAHIAEKLAELAIAQTSIEVGRVSGAALEEELGAARNIIASLEIDKARLSEELERAAEREATTAKEAAQLKDDVERLRTRAEGAEASAALASGKVRELEHRNVMALALPGRPPLGVSRHGTANLEALARLTCQLVLSQADAHLELGVVGGSRSLWLKRGQIVAAASTFEREGLIDRARRDGLIDARQESELRALRGASLKEQLEGLKARGFIRDMEAVPLVQRCAEQVALAALSEEETQYRLEDDTPGWEITPVTIPRPTLPLLAEALRRAVPVDTLLERLGGGEAVPVATDAELELRALGFSDRERRLLAKVDGTATVEELCLASGLKSDAAFRALEVARLLGAIEVHAPQQPSAKVDPELDVHRLEAKYDEIADADYFSILGLPRTAGADEVHAAWQRLSSEFHPLRFSGHPDAGLQQRAQVVFSLLEEAARALGDDRRRADYARHLLD